MSRFEGGCLCGRVRYTSEAEPVMQAVCHCRNCQKQGGTAFSVVVVAPTPTVTVTGELKTYEDQGDSGATLHRKFCPECGSPIYSSSTASPALMFIKAGTLDDTSWLDPKVHIWTESAQAWNGVPEGAHAIPRNPG